VLLTLVTNRRWKHRIWKD